MDELVGEISSGNDGRYCGSRESDCRSQLSPEQNTIWNPAHVFARLGSFCSKIDEYFKVGTYTDVNIVCQHRTLKKCHRTFRCHRLALAAACEFFDRMFCGNFAESHAENVVLQGIDSDTFEQILVYVYSGEVAAINNDNVLSMLRASDFFKLSDIEDHCVHYLTQKSIPIDDALEIYFFASALHKVSLIPATCKFILEHLEDIRRESMFLKMSHDDFSALLEYFQPSSASRETRLLDAIFQWVCSSTVVREERKSSFAELAQNLQFGTLTATYVAEYFERSSVDSNDESSHGEVSGMALDLDSKMENEESLSLHVYIGTVDQSRARQTSIFSLQKNSRGGVKWHLSHTIIPAIQMMRIVEFGGRLYTLKLSEKLWTFSSSTAIDLSSDMQLLTLPSGLLMMKSSVISGDYRTKPFSLCRLRKKIYLNGLHENVGLQCYDTELNEWSSIPALSEYEPKHIINIMSDDTRLYMILEPSVRTFNFLAYDPRVGKVEELNNEGLRDILNGWSEPAVYHRGKFYIPEQGMTGKDSPTFKMAVYDQAADRWDIMESYWTLSALERRLVSFNDRVWMFGVDGHLLPRSPDIYTQTFDSFRQTWERKYQCRLCKALSHSNLKCTNFMDVIAFKSS